MHSPSINAQLAVNGFNDRTVMHHGTMTTRIQILVRQGLWWKWDSIPILQSIASNLHTPQKGEPFKGRTVVLLSTNHATPSARGEENASWTSQSRIL